MKICENVSLVLHILENLQIADFLEEKFLTKRKRSDYLYPNKLDKISKQNKTEKSHFSITSLTKRLNTIDNIFNL